MCKIAQSYQKSTKFYFFEDLQPQSTLNWKNKVTKPVFTKIFYTPLHKHTHSIKSFYFFYFSWMVLTYCSTLVFVGLWITRDLLQILTAILSHIHNQNKKVKVKITNNIIQVLKFKFLLKKANNKLNTHFEINLISFQVDNFTAEDIGVCLITHRRGTFVWELKP